MNLPVRFPGLPFGLGVFAALIAETVGGASPETLIGSLLAALVGFLIVRGFTVERSHAAALAKLEREVIGKVEKEVARLGGSVDQIADRLDAMDRRASELYGLIGAEKEVAKQDRHDLRNELNTFVGEAELRVTALVDKLEARVTANETILRRGDR